MVLHTSGPAPGLTFSEAWNALDQLDRHTVVVPCSTTPVRAGDLRMWLHRGLVTPQVVGAYLVNAGLPIPPVCLCGHPADDHRRGIRACQLPGCGCTTLRTAAP